MSSEADKPDAAAATLAEIRDMMRDLVATQAEGIDAKAYARLIMVSPSRIYEMNTRALIPEPVTVGEEKGLRWSRAEAVAHFRAGMPSRSRWVLIRDRFMKRSA